MLIKVLRQTMLAGQVVRIGEVIEASSSDARLLIGIGKAIKVANVAATIVQAIQPEPAPKPQSPRRRAKP
jgi:hypothetical protein